MGYSFIAMGEGIRGRRNNLIIAYISSLDPLHFSFYNLAIKPLNYYIRDHYHALAPPRVSATDRGLGTMPLGLSLPLKGLP